MKVGSTLAKTPQGAMASPTSAATAMTRPASSATMSTVARARVKPVSTTVRVEGRAFTVAARAPATGRNMVRTAARTAGLMLRVMMRRSPCRSSVR